MIKSNLRKVFKRIGFTFLSLVLFYNSYKLLTLFFDLSEERFSLLAIIFCAVAFNLMITGAVAFLGFVYPTSKLFPKIYFEIKNPEMPNLAYKYLGVKYFQLFLLKTFYREADNRKYFNGSKSGLIEFDYNTKQSEFGHLISFILIFIVSMILLLNRHSFVFVWIQPMNILFNFYLVILQRKHRITIERLIKRK